MVLPQVLHQSFGAVRQGLYLNLKRNIGMSAVICQKAKDPIQQIFLDKIKEYSQKSNAAGGKMVDVNPSVEKQLQDELDKLANQFSDGSGQDLSKFPSFTFKDPELDPINAEKK